MKKTVKIISAVCAIVMLLGMLPIMSVSAADPATLVVTPSAETVKAGREFTVTVSLKNNPGVSPWIIAETALIALLICAVSFGTGSLLERKLLRREASQSLGQKNTTLTIYLALVYAGPRAAMGVISYVLWHNSYNAFQLFLTDRRKKLKELKNGR